MYTQSYPQIPEALQEINWGSEKKKEKTQLIKLDWIQWTTSQPTIPDSSVRGRWRRGRYHHGTDPSHLLGHVEARGWGWGRHAEALLPIVGGRGWGHRRRSSLLLLLLLLLPGWWRSHAHRGLLPRGGGGLRGLHLWGWNHAYTATCNNQIPELFYPFCVAPTF